MERKYPNLEEYINVFIEYGKMPESSKKITKYIINQAYKKGFEDARSQMQIEIDRAFRKIT